jgi:hypothetical protein
VIKKIISISTGSFAQKFAQIYKSKSFLQSRNAFKRKVFGVK